MTAAALDTGDGAEATTSVLMTLRWPASDLSACIEALARASGLPLALVETPPVPQSLPVADAKDPRSPDAVDDWVAAIGRWFGLEVVSVESTHADADVMLRKCGPALLRLSDERGGYLALLQVRGTRALVVGRDRRLHVVPTTAVLNGLGAGRTRSVAHRLDQLIASLQIPARRRARATRAMFKEMVSAVRVEGVWLLRPPASAPLSQALRAAKVGRRLLGLALAYMLANLLMIGGWWALGHGALNGIVDRGWLLAWLLLQLGGIPLRAVVTSLQGSCAIALAAIVKRRLLAGAGHLDVERVRGQGPGQMFGVAVESQAIEDVAVSAGLNAPFAIVDVVLTLSVMWLGAAGAAQMIVLSLFIAAVTAAYVWYFRVRRHWTDARLSLTNDLVERMIGHRTRLVQQNPARWHDGEDESLEAYAKLSARLDRLGALIACAPRAWFILGLAAAAPAMLTAGNGTALAVSIGGVLLGMRTLGKLAAGLSAFAGGAIAWRRVAPLLRSAPDESGVGWPAFVVRGAGGEVVAVDAVNASAAAALAPLSAPPGIPQAAPASVVLDVVDVSFSYGDRAQPALDRARFSVREGERILLEGPSGGGKSTLAGLLAGLRQPGSGMLLARGLDLATLGAAGWKRRVALAAQFHENHIFAESLLFNLLMGRRWLPRPADVVEAEEVCRELGLGPLIDRMPQGLMQPVGESGWQLSHGERSRVFVARSLLQDADVVVLDEGFAALDPQTVQSCMACVMKRARTLLVVAHP